MKNRELLRDIIALIIFAGLIISFHNFILENILSFAIACLFIGINYLIIFVHERKYKKNFPYKHYKNKKNILERISIGILAGFHYTFLIWNYNHKKYNTQAYYPETLECIFGNISQGIIFFVYLAISMNLFNIVGYYSLFFMAIPIMSNIINMIITLNKKKRK